MKVLQGFLYRVLSALRWGSNGASIIIRTGFGSALLCMGCLPRPPGGSGK